jgi:hypothetical protein
VIYVSVKILANFMLCRNAASIRQLDVSEQEVSTASSGSFLVACGTIICSGSRVANGTWVSGSRQCLKMETRATILQNVGNH